MIWMYKLLPYAYAFYHWLVISATPLFTESEEEWQIHVSA